MKVRKAVVEDQFHPANLPTTRTLTQSGGGLTPGTQRVDRDDLCGCGMAQRGVPHLCIQWHPDMMSGDAPKQLSEVVRRYVASGDRRPLVAVNMQSPDTLAYLREMVLKETGTGGASSHRLVRWAIKDDLVLRDSRGRRLHPVWGPPDLFGITDLTMTAEDDPAWIADIVRQNTIERSASAMPACCESPDPRIAKSGRPFCAHCKKYLDKVPKPVEAPVVVEVQK